MKAYLSEILYLLGNDRRKLPWIVMLFLTSSILDLAGIGLIAPYVSLVIDSSALDGMLSQIVDYANLPRDQRKLLIIIGCLLVGIFLVKSAVSIWANYIIIRFGQYRQQELRSYLMHAYQGMPYTKYLLRNSSEYINSIQLLTMQYAHNVLTPLMRMLGEGVVAVVILIFLAYTHAPALALLAGLFATTVIGYDRLFRRNLRSYGERATHANAAVIQGVHEGLEGLKEIRILGKEEHFHDKVKTESENYATNYIKSHLISSAPRYLIEFLLILFIVTLVIITLESGGEISGIAPVLALFAVAALRLLPMVITFSHGLTQLRYNRHVVENLYGDLQSIEKYREQEKTKKTCDESFQKLLLTNVQFHYPNTDQCALDCINLEIKAGESIGLIGSSGSGKTTLVDVLLGLLEPQQGTLMYNGKSLYSCLDEWRSQIAYLPQQVFLIDNTLRCNVALGVAEEHIDEVRLQDALKKARLAEVAVQLPQGINTLLGERGVRLSGGQRQRVALARAFYHGRDILVLDEATSALDNETEWEIVEEIKRLKGQKTMIVIAHRLSTVQNCDRVYRIEQGKIIDYGTPEKMLAVNQACE